MNTIHPWKYGLLITAVLLGLGGVVANAALQAGPIVTNCMLPNIPSGCYVDSCQIICAGPGHPSSSSVSNILSSPSTPVNNDVRDAGGWVYDSNRSDIGFGQVAVSCTHPDMRGYQWNQL